MLTDMPNIIVTGGCGFIGHNLALELVKENYEVTVIDNLTFGNNLEDEVGFKLYEQDALDLNPKILDSVGAVIHLAGLSNDPMANFRPRDNYIYNSALSSLLVFLCKQKSIKRV